MGYGCVRTVRGGGSCQGKRLAYRVGPENLTLCLRHERKYNEDRIAKLERVKQDHANGFHGTGEERKQFADTYTSGEFALRCQLCRDEMAGEELGVSAEKVGTAQAIKRSMETAERDFTQAKDSFMARWNDVSPASAVEYYGKDVLETEYTHNLWKRVAGLVGKPMYDDNGEKQDRDMDLVDTHEVIKKSVTEDLISGQVDAEMIRRASRFVRQRPY